MAKRKGSSKYDTSPLEATFLAAWKAHTTIPIKPQKVFHPRRRWRFDFALEESLLAIEIQGYGAGHASYTGMKADYEKHNAAIQLGWVVLYFMKHDLLPKTLHDTILFTKQVHESILDQTHILQAHLQINLQARAKISQSPSESYTSFQDWINRNRT